LQEIPDETPEWNGRRRLRHFVDDTPAGMHLHGISIIAIVPGRQGKRSVQSYSTNHLVTRDFHFGFVCAKDMLVVQVDGVELH
jgi:hypothetical protein